MKAGIKYFFLFIIFTQQIISQNQITVMFYNAENFFDIYDDPKTEDEEYLPQSKNQWDSKKYANKIKRISQVIDSSVAGTGLPEIVGFCEIENSNVLKDLVNKSQLKARNYGILSTTGRDTRGINVGLIFDMNCMELITSEEIDATSNEIGNYDTRNILYATFKLNKTKELLYVFVNHWPSRRDGEKITEPKRIYAAKQLRNKVNELLKNNPDSKIIIMGDLNDYPTSQSVYITLGATEKPNNDLYNPYYIKHLNGEGTHEAKNNWYVFDQIIISKSLLNSKKGIYFSEQNAFILKKDFVLFKNFKTGEQKPNRTYGPGNRYFNGYSDHLAVYLRLNI